MTEADVVGCLACDLARGRVPLPGGRIHETTHWLVEHCVGPLGLGTLLVKPARHVTRVDDLTVDEASELGPLLRTTSVVAGRLVAGTDQVYNCLWSHAGGEPGHIHYVVQPVTRAQTTTYGAFGPALQMAMFTADVRLGDDEIAAVAERARELFSEGRSGRDS